MACDNSSLALSCSTVRTETTNLDSKSLSQVVVSMKVIMRELHSSVTSLEKEAKFNKVSMREALRGLLKQATKASEFLRDEGPQLIDTLAEKYVNETVGLVG